MKVLFVLGGKVSGLHKKNEKDAMSFYIREQSEELQKLAVEIDYFRFSLSNKLSIFRRIKALRKIISENNYDLIHAHYGLFGFVSILAKQNIPLITTFHGSDINVQKNKLFSAITVRFSSFSIFVSQALYDNSLVKPNKNSSILPCGVDKNIFFPIEKSQARKVLGYRNKRKYILFPSTRTNPIKNFNLAKEALNLLDFEYELVELVKKTREEVNLIMNACDLLILTSKSEGSPQVIKEAFYTNLPIVSVNVGDVEENIRNIDNCYIAENNPKDIADKIQIIVSNNCARTNGRAETSGFDNQIIAKKILTIYKRVLKN